MSPTRQQGEPAGIRPPPSETTPALRVLVAGAGAIGQWLGLRLLQTCQDVTLLARPDHVEAIRAKGLAVHGLTEAHGHVNAIADLAEVDGTFDLVALTCKAHHTATLGAGVAPRLRPDGVFLSLQNGLGNEGKLRRVVPADRLAVALTSHGVTVETAGVLRHAGEGATLVGPAAGASPAAARTALRVLAQARLEPEWHDDMRPFVWRKALINAGINPVGALNRVRNGDLLASEPLRSLALDLLREGEAVAKAAKVVLPPGDLKAALLATLERTADNKCSMLQDVERRRATETEQITGRLLRAGARLGVAMPRTADVYARLKRLEASYLGEERAAQLARDEGQVDDGTEATKTPAAGRA